MEPMFYIYVNIDFIFNNNVFLIFYKKSSFFLKCRQWPDQILSGSSGIVTQNIKCLGILIFLENIII